MDTNGYTVISLFYNQHERLPVLKKAWEMQTVPPEEIIIVDDGSDDPVEVDWATVITLEHTMNLAKASNVGVDACLTQYCVIPSPDLIYTPNFAEVSMFLLDRTPQPKLVFYFGRHADTDSIDNLPPLPPVNDYHGDWPGASPCAWMGCRETFASIQFHEEYRGWGRYDDDFGKRFLMRGGMYVQNDSIGFYHLMHDSNPVCVKRNRDTDAFKAEFDNNIRIMDRRFR